VEPHVALTLNPSPTLVPVSFVQGAKTLMTSVMIAVDQNQNQTGRVMSTLHQLYQHLRTYLKDVTEWAHPQHVNTMAALMTAIYNSRDVRLSRIAENAPIEGKEESVVQRFRRWLKHPKIEVHKLYVPVLKNIMAHVSARVEVIRLQMDRVRIGNRFNVLMVSVGYAGRALPLTWLTIDHSGNSNAAQRREVLTYVAQFIPPHHPVRVLADREFGDVATMRLIEQDLEWDYVLRLKKNQRVYIPGSGFPITWHDLGDLVPENRDAVKLLQRVKYTQSELYPTNIVLTQPPEGTNQGKPDPWMVATSLPAEPTVIDEYAERFGCEPLFSDLKSRGFDWEKTRLRHADRLSRLVLVLAFLTTWMVLLGDTLVTSGIAATYWQPSHIDRYSLFQLGRRWLRKQLTLHGPPKIAFEIPFWQFVPN